MAAIGVVLGAIRGARLWDKMERLYADAQKQIA
jgi:hypothetical protein